jgi:hypothetical protein
MEIPSGDREATYRTDFAGRRPYQVNGCVAEVNLCSDPCPIQSLVTVTENGVPGVVSQGGKNCDSSRHKGFVDWHCLAFHAFDTHGGSILWMFGGLPCNRSPIFFATER